MARSDDERKRTWRFRLNDSTTLEVSAPKGATEKQIRRRGRLSLVLGTLLATVALSAVALASDADVAVVDTTAPTGSVTLAPTGSGVITINMSVTGKQDGTATFKVYRDWTLSGGTFTGANAQTFTVNPRAAGDPATTFSTAGSITVAAGHSDGTFTLGVGAFDITNSNTTGAKLNARTSSSYEVTVLSPTPSDTTPPSISYDLDPPSPDGNNDWYVSDVTLTWTVSEPESPGSLVETGCVDQSITADQAETTYSCSATSDGGSAGPVEVKIKRDATDPTLNPSVSPDPVVLNGAATASANASDAMSGVFSSSCDPVDTSTVGTHTVTCSAEDYAGNTNSASATYTVIYDWNGFFSPVENPGAWNSAKAGQAIPLKFSLGANQGLNILAGGYPKVVALVCPTTTQVDPIEEYATEAANSKLIYDDAADQYNYVWKTDKAWAGKCYRVDVKLNDTTTHSAYFKFTK